MKFLRDTRPFREPFFKTDVELPGEIEQPQTIKSHDREPKSDYNAGAEPRGLPKRRLDFESNVGFRAVPDAVGVAGDDTEAIGARSKVGVVGFAGGDSVAPAAIEVVQGVFESNASGN